MARTPSASATLRRGLPAVGAALSVVVIFVAVLSIPLSAASELGLSAGETVGWIVAVYGVAGVLSMLLVLRYRQPLLLTGNVFLLIFIASLGVQLSWPELVGAVMVAGALVLVAGPLGMTDWLAGWLPAPIVYGLLAGAVLPFFVDLFAALGDAPLVVGATLVAYLVGRVALGPRLPAILPALVVALLVAGLAGRFGAAPTEMVWPAPVFTAPVFSLPAIVTATPVMVVLITLQANVPSVVFLRAQGYRPPEQTLAAVSGAGTLLGSVLGPTGISLSLPATALCAGPDAGDAAVRHWSVATAAGASVLIAVLAGLAAKVAAIVPTSLLAAIVGLAVVDVLARALQEVARGPLLLGPMFAFAIALSDLSLFGLGSFFWALALGLMVSLLLERDQLSALRAEATDGTPPAK